MPDAPASRPPYVAAAAAPSYQGGLPVIDDGADQFGHACVPPLCAVPFTDTTSSSGATPRTGGGLTARSGGATTARSSDGKGTPREVERVPLGYRPSGYVQGAPGSSGGGGQHGGCAGPGDGGATNLPQYQFQQQVSTSPLTTARSGGALSSPSSSHGDEMSSRSVAAAASDTATSVRIPWLNDLSREIEVMRHVIMQENSRIRAQLEEQRELSSRLRDQLQALGRMAPIGTSAGGPPVMAVMSSGAADSAGTAGARGGAMLAAEAVAEPWRAAVGKERVLFHRRRRCIEWRILGFAMPNEGPTARIRTRRHCFELPEYPGFAFRLSFGDCSAASSSSSSSSRSTERFPGEVSRAAPVEGQATATAVCPQNDGVASSAESRDSGSGTGEADGVTIRSKPHTAEIAVEDDHLAPRGCRLRLRAFPAPGAAASTPANDVSDACLWATLEVEVQAAGSESSFLLGRSLVPQPLACGMGCAVCDCERPSGPSTVDVVCRAHLEFAGYVRRALRPLLLSSSLRAPGGDGFCGEAFAAVAAVAASAAAGLPGARVEGGSSACGAS